ncbi:MAG: 3-methyl-2-oxobutanoate hydroxymethyltransferase [Legionellales bacterium]|nr:3-methyl-2-oxobutanoate hydroxymethyltransferase [Legionellales bacterium]
MTHSLTLKKLQHMKHQNEPICALTCYDSSFAYHLNKAQIELVLVGDSLGQVIQGHDSTIPVSVNDICYHTRAVRQQLSYSFLMADIPFLAQATLERALQAAQAIMQAGAQMVKLEGGTWLIPIIQHLTNCGVPVCAHLGYTPQSVHAFSGPKLIGKQEHQAHELIESAHKLCEAGAAILVLECVPDALAETLSKELPCPVIGIGAGPGCDGQILVSYDLLGLTPQGIPPFAECFLNETFPSIIEAICAYRTAVKTGTFPTPRS